MVALLTFNPPQVPHVSSEIRDVVEFDSVPTAGGFQEVKPRNIRPKRVADLKWFGVGDSVRDYIDSFMRSLAGTAGPFLWTPFDGPPSPTGMSPTLTSLVGGALAARTYFITVTWFDTTHGETLESGRSSLAVPLNSFLRVTVPPVPSRVEGFRVYGDETSGSETLQATITNGDRFWTQSVAFVSGASPPSSNTLAPPARWLLQGLTARPRVTGARTWDIRMQFLESWV